MNIYQPYTYLIKFLPTGQVYYGSSYANNKHKVSNPEQLWITYFTSSKIITNLIKQHGIESFQFEVRKIFENRHDAVNWETRVLKKVNAKQNPLWLNKSNGGKDFLFEKHTEESKKKISNARKISKVDIWNKGKILGPHSQESNIKRSETMKNKPKKYTKISYCCICNTLIVGIPGRPTKKTCSTSCLLKHQSIVQTKIIA